MTRLFTARALLLASAVALSPLALPAACADTPADVLVVAATIDDIISLDPAQSFEFSGNDVTQNLYDRLVDFDPLDLEAGFKPSLAESWEISEDGMTVTLKMRDGVKFHSGNPVRAEDAAWSLQRAVKLDKSPAFILNQFGLTADNVDEKITADGNTLTHPAGQALCAILRAELPGRERRRCRGQGNSAAARRGRRSGQYLVDHERRGSGPYTLGAWKPNEAVQLMAFADYWQGAPELSRVIIKNVPGIQRAAPATGTGRHRRRAQPDAQRRPGHRAARTASRSWTSRAAASCTWG